MRTPVKATGERAANDRLRPGVQGPWRLIGDDLDQFIARRSVVVSSRQIDRASIEQSVYDTQVNPVTLLV